MYVNSCHKTSHVKKKVKKKEIKRIWYDWRCDKYPLGINWRSCNQIISTVRPSTNSKSRRVKSDIKTHHDNNLDERQQPDLCKKKTNNKLKPNMNR